MLAANQSSLLSSLHRAWGWDVRLAWLLWAPSCAHFRWACGNATLWLGRCQGDDFIFQNSRAGRVCKIRLEDWRYSPGVVLLHQCLWFKRDRIIMLNSHCVSLYLLFLFPLSFLPFPPPLFSSFFLLPLCFSLLFLLLGTLFSLCPWVQVSSMVPPQRYWKLSLKLLKQPKGYQSADGCFWNTFPVPLLHKKI